MQHKHLSIILLTILCFSVFQTKGQEQKRDTISGSPSMQSDRNLQLQPVQSSQQQLMPERLNNDENLHEISINRKTASFNFNRESKHLNTTTGESSSLLLPKYPGLGDYQNFGGTLGSFNITKNLAFDYGAFICAQYSYLFSGRQIIPGSNFLLHYAITNKLQFQTWGQYLAPGNNSDPVFNMRNFFPTSNFGAGLQYNSNDKTKIKVGIEYQYDQSDKTWEPESGGKVLLKF